MSRTSRVSPAIRVAAAVPPALRSAFRVALVAVFALGLAASVATRASAQRLNCNLVAHLDSLPGSGSSCWGYVDPNTDVEYAILGNQNGTAIWNIATPSEP